jgi:hypothetical protein
MATEFVLKLDLSDHEHPDNLYAQHSKVCQWLDLAKQAIGASIGRSGDLRIPIFNASEGVHRPVKIGSWAFEDETHTPNPEA